VSKPKPVVAGTKPRRAPHHHLNKIADLLIAAPAAQGSPDDLITTSELAEWLRVSTQWCEIGRHQNYGPQFQKLGPNIIRYKRSAVLEWLKQCEFSHTGEYAKPRRRKAKAALACAALALTYALAAPTPTAAQATVTGPARVIDGDTIAIGTTRVRLQGVDAAELGTARGAAARAAMLAIVGTGPLTCALTGEHTWRREVGTCTTAAGVDIGQAIVAGGWALAYARYSARYVLFEQPAALVAQDRAPYCLKR
jgi:endonuclease YncB( thermonuclease family)